MALSAEEIRRLIIICDRTETHQSNKVRCIVALMPYDTEMVVREREA
jgi:hypothetical protein